MNKHERELVVLERIVNNKRKNEKTGLYIGIPMFLAAGSMLIYIAYTMTGSLLACLAAAALTIAIIALLVRDYLTIEKKIDAMYPPLGISTDEEMEAILESSRRITNTVFMSDRYLINFDEMRVIQLCDIKKVKPVDVKNDDYTSYMLKLIMNNGKNMQIAFSGKNTRNDAVKLLSTYAGLVDGQKYIN